jgi:hypothetical protein
MRHGRLLECLGGTNNGSNEEKQAFMQILITNIEMLNRSGTTLYVRDLALELLRQGHEPEVYTLEKGGIADELVEAGIRVVTSLRQVRIKPDIIHGHHNLVTCAALLYFEEIPAIYICHDHTNIHDEPPVHDRIKKYFAVSRVCFDRVRARGIPEEDISLLKNFVDTKRFLPRPPLPPKPRRALLFSNYATDATQLPAVKEACRIAGLELDVVGMGVGRPVERPEEILGSYDIVFAKAKAAMEAMSVGTAVILCDFSGVGPLVTNNNFADLQPLNFGFDALCNPLSPEFLLKEIDRYEVEDAKNVSNLLRNSHSLDRSVQGLVNTYRLVTELHLKSEHSETSDRCSTGRACHKSIAFLSMKLYSFLLRYRANFKSVPGYLSVKNIFVKNILKRLNID